MGWQRQILRVNLTKGTCETEPLNMEWAEQFMGERGLGTKYLIENMDPKADAMGPDNVLIFATGPLTGTMALTKSDDSLPPRLLNDPAPSGTAKGKVNELSKMLPEYYEARGWTPDGEPTTQTLSRLGLT